METAMIDDENELRNYLKNKYWSEDLYPTYVWVGYSSNIEKGE